MLARVWRKASSPKPGRTWPLWKRTTRRSAWTLATLRAKKAMNSRSGDVESEEGEDDPTPKTLPTSCGCTILPNLCHVFTSLNLCICDLWSYLFLLRFLLWLNVFIFSRLKKAAKMSEEEYEVETILEKRLRKGKVNCMLVDGVMFIIPKSTRT